MSILYVSSLSCMKFSTNRFVENFYHSEFEKGVNFYLFLINYHIYIYILQQTMKLIKSKFKKRIQIQDQNHRSTYTLKGKTKKEIKLTIWQ
jgi:hypothetical protein